MSFQHRESRIFSINRIMSQEEEERDDVPTKQSETENDRGTWNNKFEFLLTCLGYAIGYGNIWRFPYLCYKNGGAAFLIPYFIVLVTTSLPLFFMELAVGQYTSLAPNVLFYRLSPITSGLGWSMIVMCFLAAIFYNMIIAWSLFYLFSSFTTTLPWQDCDNYFNSAECYPAVAVADCKNQSLYYYNRTCLSVEDYCEAGGQVGYNLTHCLHPSEGTILADGILPRMSPSEDYFKNRMLGITGKDWDNMGGIRWELVGCLALSWIIVGCCSIKGIKTLSKVAYVTAIFPYIILTILFIRGITLEGAYQGIEFYILNPDFSRLMSAEVWNDAAIQVFYSTAITFGTLITLASYNKFKNNCMRDAFIIGFMNTGTSIYAGFVIFTVLGFLAQELGVRVDEVASSGSGLIFVVYPAALGLLPVPQLWSGLFFFMLINIGVGSQMSSVETLTSALLDQFEFLRPKKPYVVVATCFILFLCGLTFCLEGGILMFEVFFWFSGGIAIILIALIQLIAIQCVYGYKKFVQNIREMGIHLPRILEGYWTITWLFTAPLVLMVIAFFYIYFYEPAYWGDYVFPQNIQILGWFFSSSSLSCIVIGMIVGCCRKGKWRDLCKTSPDFHPVIVRKEAWKSALEEGINSNTHFDTHL